MSVAVDMLPIIDRYIFREVMTTFLAVISILMLIVLAQGYLQILKQAAAGSIASGLLLQLLGTEAVKISGVVIAPAFFFAILISLGRMYRDNEMTALAGSGVGLVRVYRVVLFSALPVVLLVVWLMISLRPWAYESRLEIISGQKLTASVESAVAGRFTEFNRGDLVFYIEEIADDNSGLKQIFVQNRQHGKLGLITAGNGYLDTDDQTGERFIVLEEGYRYEGVPGDNRFSIGAFERYRVRVDEAPKTRRQLPFKAMSMEELQRSLNPAARAELEFRLMAPVAVLVFAVIAVPLSYSAPRTGVYGRLVVAVLFYFVFLNLQALSAKWMISGATPPWLGSWWVHPFMLVLLAAMLRLRRLRERGGRGLRLRIRVS